MMQQELILFIIRLVLSGIAAFFAIALWSKTRDVAWMCLVAGAVTSYAALVYELLAKLGFVPTETVTVFHIPIITLLFAVLPPLFFILAFMLMLARKR